MAKTISEEEIELRKRARRRLIGAIALVTMVAVFLPMVLDHEPKPVSQDISIQIPAPGSAGTFTSKIVPVTPADTAAVAVPALPAVDTKSEAVAAAPPAHDTEAAPPKIAPKDPVAAEKPAAPPKAVAKNAPPPKAPAKSQTNAKSTGAYVVQVAALNDVDKARELREKMAAAGVKSYTEVVPTKNGNVTRVRAGPYASRDEAEKTRDKLKELGLNGNILPK